MIVKISNLDFLSDTGDNGIGGNKLGYRNKWDKGGLRCDLVKLESTSRPDSSINGGHFCFR